MTLVTVFGGSGFIGRHLVKRLAASGATVRVAVRDPIRASFLKPMGDVGQVTPVHVDIHNDASVTAAVEGADKVVNLIGILYESGRQTFQSVHNEAARRIAAAAAAADAGASAFVHMSALGASKTSQSMYAWTKAAGEDAVKEVFPYATVVRPSVVFGVQDNFFNQFASMARMSPVLPVFGCPFPGIRNGKPDFYGDGGTKFQPVYVGDVADAIMSCLNGKAKAGQVYELAGPNVYSFKALMELVLEATDRKALLMPVPFAIASMMGGILGLLPVPPLTSDQVTLLKTDNVLSGTNPTLADLGVTPTAAEIILPTYLEKYRRGGRFHKTAAT